MPRPPRLTEALRISPPPTPRGVRPPRPPFPPTPRPDPVDISSPSPFELFNRHFHSVRSPHKHPHRTGVACTNRSRSAQVYLSKELRGLIMHMLAKNRPTSRKITDKLPCKIAGRPPMQRLLQQRVGAAWHWRGRTGPVGAAEERRRHDLRAARWSGPCASCTALCCAMLGMRPTGWSVAGEGRGGAVGGAHEDAVARG
jgi:hypothetical protein